MVLLGKHPGQVSAGLTGTAFNGGLLLRVDGSGGGTNWIFTTQGIFIVDSSIVVNADYPMQISDHTPWLVVKGSTIDRQRAGQHTIRIDGPNQERILIQDSRILGTGNQDSLTIRGNSRWILVQNTFFDQHAGTYDSQPGDSRLQEKIVWERNAFDRSNNAIDWGFRFQGRDIIVRDNVVYGRGGQFDYMATGGGAGAPKNIWFVNNTSIDNDTNGIRLNNCSTCVAKNNLIYSGNSPWGDCITGTSGANVDANWCSTNDECLDPVDGDRDCYDPNFMSLTYGSADFARPGAGTRGIDAADQTVPVWYDFYGRVSSNLDIGAVEK